MHTLSLSLKPCVIIFTDQKVWDLTFAHGHNIVDNDTLVKHEAESITERRVIKLHALTRTPPITPPVHCVTVI